MHSDSYFCVGASHNVCQDYALAGVTEKGKAFAIVSDGCSGSPNTDFGSRFLTKSMQFALDHNEEHDKSLFLTADALGQQMASSCNMEPMCLDATILCLVEHEREGRRGVLALAGGDGVIVARHRGRSYYDTHLIEFYAGFPAYPSYMADLPRMQEFIKHTEGGLASVRVTNGEDDTVNQIRHTFYSTETDPWYTPYEVFFDAEKYDVVMILTDGATSFQETASSDTSKRLAPLKLDSVLKELTDFKNLKGEFVVRRAKRFLTKTCVENHWVHHDDLSVAAISME
jgi:hypothetical protein